MVPEQVISSITGGVNYLCGVADGTAGQPRPLPQTFIRLRAEITEGAVGISDGYVCRRQGQDIDEIDAQPLFVEIGDLGFPAFLLFRYHDLLLFSSA